MPHPIPEPQLAIFLSTFVMNGAFWGYPFGTVSGNGLCKSCVVKSQVVINYPINRGKLTAINYPINQGKISGHQLADQSGKNELSPAV